MKTISCIIALVVCCNIVNAAEELIDLPSRNAHYHTTIVINEDGTAVELREWSMTVLKQSALEWAKQYSITHSTSVEKAEVVTAYTKKADGKRIDVPKNNYQVKVNTGREKGGPVFSDRTTLTVVFPDVAVGDTVVFSYKITQTEPLFPKHYSITETFAPHVAYDDVRVRIDYPASLWVQYQARGMKQKESENKNRKIVEWEYANPKPVKNERRNYSVFDPDKETGYAFSTFRSYGDIAAAYGVRALPKAAVTERIQKLAADIVKDKTAPKDQARALYDWVATNITYAGNCIGIGAVVPHDISFILDNKMGDCKDHATLLQALLAARGINSTQALVNAGSIYRLPKIPVVSSVNHVITYIPAFDLYLDSTSDSTPFGLLPSNDADKPVLLVEGYKDGTKTPAAPPGTNQQTMKSALKLAADGSIAGTVEVSLKGEWAAQTRAMARNLTKEVEEDFIKNMFRSWGQTASGKFEKDDPTALLDTHRYKATFNMERFVNLSAPGAFQIYPLMFSPGAIKSFLQYSMEPEKEADVTCSNGTSTEEYVIELPKTMKVLATPNNMKIENDFLSYSATYRMKGNVLTVKRTMDDRTKGNVCSPKVFIEYKKFGEKVIDDLKAQVLYK